MYEAYTRIFTRIGLKFRAVQADGGSIGGSVSQEFHVLADSGEDAIAFSDADDYASNLENGGHGALARSRARRRAPPAKVATPNARTIAEFSALPRRRAGAAASRPCWSMAATATSWRWSSAAIMS
jgi:prolyl-tRNA synthetase